MKKDGKYRYSLQFGMSSEEEIRAGELLESLGNKKSKVLIAALNEYVTNHPELESERCELRVSYQSIPMELLETKIRQLVDIAVKYGGGGHAKASGACVATKEIAMQMLSDLNALTKE